MNIIRNWTPREKFLLLIASLLVAILSAGWNPSQAANNNTNQLSTHEQLYEKAKEFGEKGDLGPAVAYLYAYMHTEEYAKYNKSYRDEINKVLVKWVEKIRDDQAYVATVKMHLESCDLYPCDKKRSDESGLTAMYAEVFPADLVRVCENINYKGKCSYLKLGEYNSWRKLGVRNDSISSIMVGDNVKVLLCAHSLNLLSTCMEFTRDDSNLTNNILPSTGNSMNDVVSTARVTYKPGRNLTLP